MAIEITRAEADTLLKTPLISKLLIEWIKVKNQKSYLQTWRTPQQFCLKT